MKQKQIPPFQKGYTLTDGNSVEVVRLAEVDHHRIRRSEEIADRGEDAKLPVAVEAKVPGAVLNGHVTGQHGHVDAHLAVGLELLAEQLQVLAILEEKGAQVDAADGHLDVLHVLGSAHVDVGDHRRVDGAAESARIVLQPLTGLLRRVVLLMVDYLLQAQVEQVAQLTLLSFTALLLMLQLPQSVLLAVCFGSVKQ